VEHHLVWAATTVPGVVVELALSVRHLLLELAEAMAE
jgi:hypothetical protein